MPDLELPADDPARTEWELAALSGRQEEAVMNAILGTKDAQMATTLSEIARLACRGWSKLIDGRGTGIEFVEASGRDARVLGLEVRGCASSAVWGSIPFLYRKELAEIVVGRIQTGLSEDSRKNS